MTRRASAMLLAAGRGQRMRPLTDHCPKPLLQMRGKPLLQWLLEALRRDGCRAVVLNTAWRGDQLSDHFGVEPGAPSLPDLAGLRISYSHEGRDFGQALGTAGGIARALPMLDQVFWVCAGDIFAPDFVFSAQTRTRFAASDKLAHLWLVPNPPQHASGDFGLGSDGLVQSQAAVQYTYGGIGLYRAAFFATLPSGNAQGLVAALAPMQRAAMDKHQVSGELYHGAWTDVGSPERLAQLNLDSNQ